MRHRAEWYSVLLLLCSIADVCADIAYEETAVNKVYFGLSQPQRVSQLLLFQVAKNRFEMCLV